MKTEQIIAKIDLTALLEKVKRVGKVICTPDELQALVQEYEALAAEVKRLTEENTSITNALEFLGVECAAELRWIPIRSADDLPKENGFYLATCGSVGIDPDDTTSHELNWFGGKWYLPSDEMIEMDGVIAWMKKPKPYTEPADNIGEELHVIDYATGNCNLGCCKGEPECSHPMAERVGLSPVDRSEKCLKCGLVMRDI